MARRRLPFQDRFADLVRSGQKMQTIRAPRKRPIVPGDTLVFYRWTGTAYRSKTETLGEGICKSVQAVQIRKTRGRVAVFLDGKKLSFDHATALAGLDGFFSFLEFVAWFDRVHGLPFEGVLIRW